MHTEAACISRALQLGQVEELVSRGIDSSFFRDDSCRIVYRSALDHLQRYGVPPSLQVIREQHPSFALVLTDDSLTFLTDRLVTLHKRRVAGELLMELARACDDAERSENIDVEFLDAAQQVMQLTPSSSHARFSDVEKRIEEWKRRRESGELWGIRYGLPTLDDRTLGIQPTELVTLAAWLGTGKSTELQWIALNGLLQSKRVLFLSLEMSREQIMRRFDAMAASLDYDRLRKLDLNDTALARWDQWRYKVSPSNGTGADIIVLDKLDDCPPERVFAEIVRYKPDICFLDYVNLMEPPPDRALEGWQAVKYITRKLKLTAQNLSVPIVMAAQINRAGAGTHPRAEYLANGISIGQDSDVVLGLYQDDDLEAASLMQMDFIKIRDAKTKGNLLLNWRHTDMNFGERGSFMRSEIVSSTNGHNPFMRGNTNGRALDKS